MKISNSKLEIKFEGNEFYIEVDRQILKTPKKNPVRSKSLRLIEHILFDLECEDEIDNSFYQYRIGLFDENNWQAYRRIIKKLLEDKYVKIMLENNISDFSEEFQDELKLIKEAKSSAYPLH